MGINLQMKNKPRIYESTSENQAVKTYIFLFTNM